jgi:hypothetical protein
MRLEYLTEQPTLIICGLVLIIRNNCFSTVVSETLVMHCGNENYRLPMYRKVTGYLLFELFYRALCSDVRLRKVVLGV